MSLQHRGKQTRENRNSEITVEANRSGRLREATRMEIGRRSFLTAAGAAFGGTVLHSPVFRKSAVESEMAMLVDTSHCSGCWKCGQACAERSHPEDGSTFDPRSPPGLSATRWITLFPVERGKVWSLRKHSCMHCATASCEQACAASAISHQGAGVVIDQSRCTGCGYCVQACPFGVPHLDESTGTSRKCDFCAERVRDGQAPACAEACTTGAISYGKRDELISDGMTRVAALRRRELPDANLYGQDSLGGLRVVYVLDDTPAAYGLPEAPRPAGANQGFKWLSSFLTFGLTAVIPLLWLFGRRHKAQAAKARNSGESK